METKTYFKVSMFNPTAAYSITSKLIEKAAMANGGSPVSLSDLYSLARMEQISYPGSLGDITVNLNGHTITIDRGTECLLMIEEREELVLPENDAA